VKRLFWLTTLFALLLTACGSAGTDAECREGICLSLNLEGPVKAMEPVRFVILVETDREIAGLGVGIFVGHGVTVSDVDPSPANAVVAYQDDRSLDWLIDTIPGREYTFAGHLVLSSPIVSYGISDYSVTTYAGNASTARVTRHVNVYLHPDGNEADATEVKAYFESTIIAPSAPPDLTIVPRTLIPSVTPYPPTPAASATVPGYPESATTTPFSPTLATPTSVPAYPGPEEASPTAEPVSSPVAPTAAAP
jgi:hypothetical protein